MSEKTITSGAQFVAGTEEANREAYQSRLDLQMEEAAIAVKRAIEEAKKNIRWNNTPATITFELQENALPEVVTALEELGWIKEHDGNHRKFKNKTAAIGQVARTSDGKPLTPATIQVPSCESFTSMVEATNKDKYQEYLDGQMQEAADKIGKAIEDSEKNIRWDSIPVNISFEFSQNALPEVQTALEQLGWVKEYPGNSRKFKNKTAAIGQVTRTAADEPLTPGEVQVPSCDSFTSMVEETNKEKYQKYLDDQMKEAADKIGKAIEDSKENIRWNSIPVNISFEFSQNALPEVQSALEQSGWVKEYSGNSKRFKNNLSPKGQVGKTSEKQFLEPAAIEIPHCNTFLAEAEGANQKAYQERLNGQLEEALRTIPTAVANAKKNITWSSIPDITFSLEANPLPETVAFLATFGWIQQNNNSRTFVNKEKAKRQTDETASGNTLTSDVVEVPKPEDFINELEGIYAQMLEAKALVEAIMAGESHQQLQTVIQEQLPLFQKFFFDLKGGVISDEDMAAKLAEVKPVTVKEIADNAAAFAAQLKLFEATLAVCTDAAEFTIPTDPLPETVEALGKMGWVLKAGETRTFTNVLVGENK
ncbi:MAG: hypothetical protein FWC79_06335 [Oscillospiraceae bacterium]|nr:hypothetical protein [Oscillospiraceae bacterium]